MNDQIDAKTGYGKPPRANQFQKGQSGNPNGRPKGSRNMSTIIKRDGRQRVRVSGPDGTRYITKQEAVVTQIGNKVANGDLAAARLYFALHQHVEAVEQNKPSPQLANERDSAGKRSFLKRFQRSMEVYKSSAQDEPQEKEEL